MLGKLGKLLGFFLVGLVLANLLTACSLSKKSAEPRWFVLATTPDLNSSGLLDVILPPFEQANNVRVKRLPVTYSQALAYARDGGVDGLLVENNDGSELAKLAGPGPTLPHFDKVVNLDPLNAPTPALQPTPTPSFDFIMTGRKVVFWSDLVLVGPSDDPAKVSAQYDAGRAFKWIALNNVPFVMPSTAPGLREQEARIWKLVGRNGENERGTGYRIVEGDSQVALKEAAAKNAYTFVPYYLYLNSEQQGKLKVILRNDPTFFIAYETSIPNVIRIVDRDVSLSQAFVYYLTNSTTQSTIYNFKKSKIDENVFEPAPFTVYRP